MEAVAVLTSADFWQVADQVKALDLAPQERLDLTQTLAKVLAKTNPMFQRDLFVKACIGARR